MSVSQVFKVIYWCQKANFHNLRNPVRTLFHIGHNWQLPSSEFCLSEVVVHTRPINHLFNYNVFRKLYEWHIPRSWKQRRNDACLDPGPDPKLFNFWVVSTWSCSTMNFSQGHSWRESKVSTFQQLYHSTHTLLFVIGSWTCIMRTVLTPNFV